jgi:thiol:disulfide interchange protein DsbD
VARAGPGAEDSAVAALFHGSFWWLIASFFGFGLLLALTPCVLPMIPILSGIIVGRSQPLARAHALMLSGAYVLGMALTYALAGVAAGLSGAMLSATLQNPWVLGGFAAVFVGLALSMFGFYELQLPVALQSRLAEVTNRLPGAVRRVPAWAYCQRSSLAQAAPPSPAHCSTSARAATWYWEAPRCLPWR